MTRSGSPTQATPLHCHSDTFAAAESARDGFRCGRRAPGGRAARVPAALAPGRAGQSAAARPGRRGRRRMRQGWRALRLRQRPEDELQQRNGRQRRAGIRDRAGDGRQREGAGVSERARAARAGVAGARVARRLLNRAVLRGHGRGTPAAHQAGAAGRTQRLRHRPDGT